MAAMVHQFYNDSEWGFAEYVEKVLYSGRNLHRFSRGSVQGKAQKGFRARTGAEGKQTEREGCSSGIAAAALFLIVGHAAFGYGLIRYSLNFSTGSSDIWI